MPFSETDINLEIPFAEQAANLKDNSLGKMCKDGGGDTLRTVCFLFIAIIVFIGEQYCLNDIYLTLSELGLKEYCLIQLYGDKPQDFCEQYSQ